ncbi:MAG TPA: CaiB/BaiF CoA-transferase family protein [Actinomycetota bacterium]|nr:CaiB/BaiF CoA-transferase family protein [Actinomycetota bacterium]
MDEQLAGITVLDHSTVGPASRCTQILGDLGAQVIKIGPVGGDRWPPPWFAYGAGRRTKRARFDLKSERGRDAFLTLASRADVIVDSFRPGVADKLGVGFEAVHVHNPRLIYCATSGYGQFGPYRDRAGHDINYLAIGGFLATQGTRQDGGPAIPGATVADSAGGGMHAAIAILAALVRRAHSHEGVFLDVSTTEGVLALTSLNVDEYLATGTEPGPGTGLLTGKYACYEVYQARDGKWLAVGAIEPKFFSNLCSALGLSDLAQYQMDDSRQDELRGKIAEAFSRRNRDEWVLLLADSDCCVTPVLSIAEVSEDLHLNSRDVFSEIDGPQGEKRRQVAPVIAGALRESHYEAVSQSASNTAQLLSAAGLDDDEIGSLLEAGVIE